MKLDEMRDVIAKELLDAVPAFQDARTYPSGVTFVNAGNCYSLYHLNGGHYLDMSKFGQYDPDYHTFLYWALGLESRAKDKEIVELKADNSGLLLVRQKLIEGIGIMDAENKHLREGLEEILRAQEYEGFLLVSPAMVEKLLENSAAGENPTSVDKNNS